VLGFIFNEAMRDLRRAGRVGVSAILLIALSLTALGGFWLLSLNLGARIAQWGDRVRVSLYLKDEPPRPASRSCCSGSRAVGGVQRLRFVSKAEALRCSSARWAARPTWPSSSRATRCRPQWR
jgi:cell division protein FtsX